MMMRHLMTLGLGSFSRQAKTQLSSHYRKPKFPNAIHDLHELNNKRPNVIILSSSFQPLHNLNSIGSVSKTLKTPQLHLMQGHSQGQH